MHPAPATCSGALAAATNTFTRFFVIPLLAFALLFALSETADAKRLGGGGSFGSKPSYGSSYSKSVPPKDASMGQQQRQATPGQQAAPGQPAPSRFGGMGGMLGGMLMGGLIGSMLFGGGFGGVGMFDILLLAGGAFLLFRLLRSRRAATATASASPYAYAGSAPQDTHAPTGSGWGHLGGGGAQAAPSGPAMPAGVDEQEFLAGAKMLYTRLQSSWDRRDLDDIREFTSDEVYGEIARQAATDPGPSRTDILTVESRVVEARQNGSEVVISVLFDALLREDQSAAQATQTREVWHFSRDESAAKPQWTLEGIQQLDI